MEVAQRENALLRQKLDLVLRRMFGSSSEKVSKDQLELLLALAETPAPAPVEKEKPMEPAPRPRKERRQRLPENLPVVEEILEPEAVKAEPGQWRRIGEEVSEQLDYEPGRFFRRRPAGTRCGAEVRPGREKGNPEDLVGPRGGKSPWWRRRELNPRPWTADLQRTTCLASLDFLRSCDRPTWNSFA